MYIEKMIHIKQLSGDYITIECPEKEFNVATLAEMMPSPFPVFFLDGKELEKDDWVSNESELCVVFQSYRTYFVWCGLNNSVWPGERDKTYCIDCTSREMVDWDPSIVTANDAVAVDYLSFGVYSPYNNEIKSALGIDFLPLDMDREELFSILDSWKKLALTDSDVLSYHEFLYKYSMMASSAKYVWLFRVTDNYCRTALEWIKRVTE